MEGGEFPAPEAFPGSGTQVCGSGVRGTFVRRNQRPRGQAGRSWPAGSAAAGQPGGHAADRAATGSYADGKARPKAPRLARPPRRRAPRDRRLCAGGRRGGGCPRKQQAERNEDSKRGADSRRRGQGVNTPHVTWDGRKTTASEGVGPGGGDAGGAGRR